MATLKIEFDNPDGTHIPRECRELLEEAIDAYEEAGVEVCATSKYRAASTATAPARKERHRVNLVELFNGLNIHVTADCSTGVPDASFSEWAQKHLTVFKD